MSDLTKAPDEVPDQLEEENDILAGQLARIEAMFIPSIPGEVVYRKIDGESPVTVWREQRRMTVESLAEAAKVSAAQVLRWERDEPITLRELGRPAEALKVSADELIPYPQRD